VTEHERDDERIVELTGNWDEVGHEVKRQCQVSDKRQKQQLQLRVDAMAMRLGESRNDAVGDERRERGPRRGDRQRRDECCVDDAKRELDRQALLQARTCSRWRAPAASGRRGSRSARACSQPSYESGRR
jgi:hypothetical protein